jgi:hypothetical protein
MTAVAAIVDNVPPWRLIAWNTIVPSTVSPNAGTRVAATTAAAAHVGHAARTRRACRASVFARLIAMRRPVATMAAAAAVETVPLRRRIASKTSASPSARPNAAVRNAVRTAAAAAVVTVRMWLRSVATTAFVNLPARRIVRAKHAATTAAAVAAEIVPNRIVWSMAVSPASSVIKTRSYAKKIRRWALEMPARVASVATYVHWIGLASRSVRAWRVCRLVKVITTAPRDGAVNSVRPSAFLEDSPVRAAWSRAARPD